MYAPVYVHIWEDIAQIDFGHVVGGLLDKRPPSVVDVGIACAVIVLDAFGNLSACSVAIWVAYLQDFHGFLADIGKFRTDEAPRYAQVHGICRQFEGVRRPV